jgi:hypothetical protein
MTQPHDRAVMAKSAATIRLVPFSTTAQEAGGAETRPANIALHVLHQVLR